RPAWARSGGDGGGRWASARRGRRVFVGAMARVPLEPVAPTKVAKLEPPASPPPPSKPTPKPMPGEPPKGEVLKLAGKVDAYAGAVVAAEAKAVLLSLPAGGLKLFSYPDLKLQGSYQLAALPPRPALHPRQALLYA